MSVLSSISKIIPPPQYIALPSAGVDISDTSIKYIQFEKKNRYSQELDLKNWGDIDLPDGVFERGIVKDQVKFAQAMKEISLVCGTPYVRVSLPEERAYIFETEIEKGTSYKEIEGLLEFRLEENVPISPRDAYFDYDVIDDNSRPGSLRVIVTVYNKDLINSYYEACLTASMVPLSFEVEAQAIARAVIPADRSGLHMIVDFGKTRSGVGIVQNGILMNTSTIDIGGSELSTALRKVVGDLSESELTKIKNTQGLIRGTDNPEVSESLINLISITKDEIIARMEYWNNKEQKHGDKDFDSIILCGGSINLKGLPEYLSESLQLKVVRADVWQNAFPISKKIPPIGRRYSYGYATAIGLALGGLKDIV